MQYDHINVKQQDFKSTGQHLFWQLRYDGLMCFILFPSRIILMEMEAHADAWPFLEPVNPRLVPGYRRIIKNPMDFLTMRERLLQGG